MAENQREKQGEQQGKPHAMEEGEKNGICTIFPNTLPS